MFGYYFGKVSDLTPGHIRLAPLNKAYSTPGLSNKKGTQPG